MKFPTVAFASAILVSLLAFSQSGEIRDFPSQFETYSIIDPIIKAILESLKPKLANLKIQDINETIKNPNLNASIVAKDIMIQNADKFVIKVLKSNMIPLKLANLTLTWSTINGKGSYDVDTNISLPQLKGPVRLFGNGKTSVTLKDLFVTIGANMEMKNNAIQIKPKGLFGFDVSIRSANVTLSSILGSAELGNYIGVFISESIPGLVNALKKPLFDAFQDDIIKIVNDVLKKNGTKYEMDEPEDSSSVSDDFGSDLSADLSSEFGSFFYKPIDLDIDESESNFEF